jgi:RNA polymerase sigma-70 factor (ECF subfamily)
LKERSFYDNLSLQEIFTKLADTPDRALYNYFFNKYYPKLIWFALIYVKQHNLAEEIVSDVMLNIFKKRQKLAVSENIEGYIFISVKNQSLKYLRKNKKKIFIDNYENEADVLFATSETPEFQYIHNEFHLIIKQAIDSLPTKRKLVFRMIKEEGLKYQEVARILDLSIKTVESHMGLALKTIHACIEGYKNERANGVSVIALKN